MKMKFLVATFLFIGCSFGQEKEKVHSVVVVRHDVSWYVQQYELWKKEVEKNDQDGEAWYNYYMAARGARNTSDGDNWKKYDQYCHEIADAAYKAIPNSFEGNHLKYRDQGLGANEKYLMKAYKLAPNDPRVREDIMIHAEVKRENELFHEMAVSCYNENLMPGAMLNWAYNLLAEVDEKAIVFSAGDNDTYALWLMQEAKSYRTDVQIINTYMILIDDYREKLFKELGIPPFEVDKNDDSVQRKLVKHVMENYSGSVHISVSAMNYSDEDDWFDDLYLTGLSYKYSKESFDNMSIIRRNYEKRYLLDHIEMTFAPHQSDERAEHFKGLYLPAMIKLYNHYALSEDLENKEKVGRLLKMIGKATGKSEDIETLLKSDLKGC